MRKKNLSEIIREILMLNMEEILYLIYDIVLRNVFIPF